ncbi:hypothetical protein X975_19769, partial [Stegodyphus mimosarum]
MNEGLIASNYECPTCDERMGLYERKSAVLDGFEWRCRKKGVNAHDVCRSIRKNLWFSKSKLSMHDILHITKMWFGRSIPLYSLAAIVSATFYLKYISLISVTFTHIFITYSPYPTVFTCRHFVVPWRIFFSLSPRVWALLGFYQMTLMAICRVYLNVTLMSQIMKVSHK